MLLLNVLCAKNAKISIDNIKETEVVEEKDKSDEPIIKDKSKGKKSKAVAKTGAGKIN